MVGNTKKKTLGCATHRTMLTACALALSIRLPAHGADTPLQVTGGPEGVNVEVFQEARYRSGAAPRYPNSEKQGGKEGWVTVNMMIDPKGKPYEITVIDSSGIAAFEHAAIEAASQVTFTPAKRGDTPIDSSTSLKMTFWQSSPAKGARHDFVEAYKDLMKALDSGDQRRAEAALTQLSVQNLYEDAFLGFGQYQYDRQWGTEADQLVDLRRAVASERVARYLPEAVFRAALVSLFKLEVKLNDFGSALDLWKTLRPIVQDPTRTELQRAVDQMKAIQSSDQAVHTSQKVDKAANWNGYLFRNRFDIAVTRGAVSEIKLRCQKQYLFFKYEPGTQYTVNSKDAGECHIEVIGDPGSIFELTQS